MCSVVLQMPLCQSTLLCTFYLLPEMANMATGRRGFTSSGALVGGRQKAWQTGANNVCWEAIPLKASQHTPFPSSDLHQLDRGLYTIMGRKDVLFFAHFSTVSNLSIISKGFLHVMSSPTFILWSAWSQNPERSLFILGTSMAQISFLCTKLCIKL